MKKFILFIVGFLYITPLLAQDNPQTAQSKDVPQQTIVSIDNNSDVSPAAITQVFIQNETISSNNNFNADNIYIGSNVTTLKPEGEVIFNGGTITMSASEFVLQPTITISTNATITLTTK